MSMCISACLEDSNVIMPPANLFNEGSSLLLPYAVYLSRGLVSGVQKCKREMEKRDESVEFEQLSMGRIVC